MVRSSVIGTLLLCAAVVSARGQVIVNEDFGSYANAAALTTAWPPDAGDGITPTGGPIGILVPCVSLDPCPPSPFDGTGNNTTLPPIDPLTSQAAAFNTAGGVNEWDNDNNPSTVPFSLLPSSSKNVRYSADIFDDGGEFPQSSFGRRFSVGLRNDTIDREPGTFGFQAGLNFLELGMWNATAIDPIDGTTSLPSTQLGFRVVLFGPPSAPLIQNPNWQYFPLPAEFDDPLVDHNGDGRFGDGDGLVDHFDVGPGWHRYSATVTETGVELSLDLFRDGTIDSTVSYQIPMNTDPANPSQIAPFTSLRMGGPSGVSMNEFTIVDNVKLELVDIMTAVDGDFNNDDLWNCDDINALTSAIASGSTDLSFDMNGDGMVTVADVNQPASGWLAVGGAHNPGATGGDPFLPGDANLNGSVDGSDFGIWNSSKFTSNSAWCGGDFNASGAVDGSDFGIWNANKFTSSLAAAVPEPGILWILVGTLTIPVFHGRGPFGHNRRLGNA